jgi:transposase
MGVPYEQVLRWCKPDVAESEDRARSDYQWRKPEEAAGENRADLLEICRTRCFDNVEMAMMLGRMKFKEGLKYVGNTELPF